MQSALVAISCNFYTVSSIYIDFGEANFLSLHFCLGLDTTKPVFGVSEKAILKPVSSATVTSYKIEISLIASLDKVLSKKQITKTLISMRGYAGWSAPCLQTPKTGFLASRAIFVPQKLSRNY